MTHRISFIKAFLTGKHVKLLEKKYPDSFGYKKNNSESLGTQVRPDVTPEQSEEYALRSAYRATNKIQLLIQGNMFNHQEEIPKFLTLTFRENITELKKANKLFRHFIKRLNRKCKKTIRYVAVPEFQKRGAVHYHLLIFNLPYIKAEVIEQQIWKNGIINLRACYRTKGLFYYLTKYMVKSFSDPRCKGEKRYFYSLEQHTQLIRRQEHATYIKKGLNSADIIYENTREIKDKQGQMYNIVKETQYLIGGWPTDSPPYPSK
jgi:hypothetical protein